jgi:molybdopterin-guanine dinucleotide biosynthesis protein A
MLRVGGIVLCGGQSSRMGRPKAWLDLGGEPMLRRVVGRLGQAVAPVAVAAAAGQELPQLPQDVRIVRDLQPDRGPLQGLAMGLQALAGLADAAFVCGCDVPFLRPPFVRRLIALLDRHAACAPCVGGLLQPLAAVYRLEVAEVAWRLLAEDRLRTAALLEAVATRVVGPEELADVDPQLESLRNLNTPEDYQAALQAGGTGRANEDAPPG